MVVIVSDMVYRDYNMVLRGAHLFLLSLSTYYISISYIAIMGQFGYLCFSGAEMKLTRLAQE